VLCYLQGLTRDEAAKQLAVPPTTLKSQPERARRRLGGLTNVQAYGGSYERAKATQKEIDDRIVDKQFGHLGTRGQGGMYNPEYMHAYKIIEPKATDRAATLDVTYQPAEAAGAK
jgi:hypothetical protein